MALKRTRYFPICSDYPQCFIDAFRAEIYKVGKLVSCEENDMKIDFLLTGMLSILVKYRPLTNSNQQQMEFMMGFLTAVIKELFPEFYSAS